MNAVHRNPRKQGPYSEGTREEPEPEPEVRAGIVDVSRRRGGG